MFDIFYFGNPPGLFPHEQQITSLEQAQQLSRTRFCWVVNNLTDYTGFDFTWEPTPWQAHQRHVWPSQWQKDSGTYLLPKTAWTETNYRNEFVLKRLPSLDNWQIPKNVEAFDYSWHPDPTDPPFNYQFGTKWQKTGGPLYIVNGSNQIKYVDQINTDVKPVATKVIVIDHLDGNVQAVVDQVSNKVTNVSVVRYFDNYLDILKRIARNSVDDDYVWVCSSVCDYTNFDFTWHPEQWQSNMLHVFASNEQKFGDTFFMNTETFRNRSENCKLLDWYDNNFVKNITVTRRPLPQVKHNYDTHVEAIKTIDWSGPLAVFSTRDSEVTDVPTVSLWREETKTIMPLSQGASDVIVPKVAVPYIKKQVYDYPYIDKTHTANTDKPLDIVFIDNGEANAEDNWRTLTQCHLFTNQRIERSKGVKGRVAAYQAAAELSTTPWFFAVFAKLCVNQQFDWSWQPDRLQEPKHYIFHAYNPVNGLTYGHQAMIAYNKELVLNNPGIGLDFTLDSAHEVVPILSGTAMYNETPWMAWRTAFREVIKLKHSLPDIENEYRLGEWIKPSSSKNGDYSMWGAVDAIEYYDAVKGDFNELKKSYDWSWLASYAFLKRSLAPD